MKSSQTIRGDIFSPESSNHMKINGQDSLEWGVLDAASRSSRNKKYSVNWEKIISDIKNVEHLLDYTIDPRAKHHLDTTKLAYHQGRIDAWLKGERVAPLTIDMA